MGFYTLIAWTHHTFNAWWGCWRFSAGCINCYAEQLNKRWRRAVWGRNGLRWVPSEAYWAEPVLWNKKAAAAGVRRRVFSNSMSDVFEEHDDLPPLRARLFSVIRQTLNLEWLLLTKRPENIAAMVPADWGDGYPNVTLMTSVENGDVDHRIATLQGLPAVRRGLSCEPLIGPVELRGRLAGIHWVIVGGESGGGARPMDAQWVRDIRDACAEQGVAFFFKQAGNVLGKAWGTKKPHGDDPSEWPSEFRLQQLPDGLGEEPSVGGAGAAQGRASWTDAEALASVGVRQGTADVARS